MLLYDIGTKVKINNPHTSVEYERTGMVCGHTQLYAAPTLASSPVYLIRLDKGFYSPEQDMYCSVLVVQPDCVSEVSK